jgi:alkylhydroperoxidase family enzyme
MAFFDVPLDEQIPPESARMLQEYSRLVEREAPTAWRTYGRNPRILEARLTAFRNLNFDSWSRSRFSREAMAVGAMLIAHARRCEGCFNMSRVALTRLGFDEPTMDDMCANPGALPLGERDRLFVQFALKVALSPADLKPGDFAEMMEHGFSRDEIQEIIGYAAYWVLNTIFITAGRIGLDES